MDKKKRRFLMRSIILIILFGAIFFTVYTTLTQDKNEVLPTTILINSEGKIEKIITGEMKEQDIKNYMELILPD
ncbi:thioredoxin domain-containing protein [Lysinibacillus capsici]|uniref:hypothetical protein n=1 Tax=Lysinibacillus capsici TaxID=2115968 RepID=UPI002DC04308|nr:hypothetical protein [Lysinibacillus capsici]MEC1303643.1 hypothetical protein [Lysinibacillus capsici]